MAGKPRTQLADWLVAEALDVLRDGGSMPPEALRIALSMLTDSELAPEAIEMAMRRLARHPDVVTGSGLVAHRIATNGSRVHS